MEPDASRGRRPAGAGRKIADSGTPADVVADIDLRHISGVAPRARPRPQLSPRHAMDSDRNALSMLILGIAALGLAGCGAGSSSNPKAADEQRQRGTPSWSATSASRPPMQTPSLHRVHFNLYVADQERSRVFYARVLQLVPSLDVPGMTEFILPGGTVLGLAPEKDIDGLFGPHMPSPSLARGVPRAELYLLVSDPETFHARAVAAGAKEVSPLLPRYWGHQAAYSLDPDGHVLAFAKAMPTVGR